MRLEPSERETRLQEMDEAAYRLARDWYRNPDLQGLDLIMGISLCEMAEYDVIPILLEGIKAVADVS